MSVSRELGVSPAEHTFNVEVFTGTETTYTFAVAVDSFGQIVDVSPPGHPFHIAWQSVSGATKAEVHSATLRIGPAALEEPDNALNIQDRNPHKLINIPGGKRVRTLKLTGLEGRTTGPEPSFKSLSSASDLRNHDFRLLVSVPDGAGGFAPVHAVPALPARGAFPASLTGASYQNNVLRFSTLLNAEKVRLSVVKSNFPEDPHPVSMRLTRVTGTFAAVSRNLEIVDPQGNVIGSFPGEFPVQAPSLEFDLRFALEAALNKALGENRPLEAVFRLRGDAPGVAQVQLGSVSGNVLRTFPGVTRTQIEGEPKQLDLPLAEPLAGERPSSVTADVTVRYQGIRILETVSDDLPAKRGDIHGVVVGEDAVVRTLPPAPLAGLPIARVGLIGRAPLETELSLQFVEMSAGVPGKPLGPPAVINILPEPDIGVTWIDIAEMDFPDAPVGASLRATAGRFFWVREDDRPLLRIVVRDPDPGNRPLFLGGIPIFTADQLEANSETGQIEKHFPARSLPPEAFQSTVPELESDLFLTVDLGDIALRYGR